MKTRRLENTYTVHREEGQVTLHLRLSSSSVSINWTPGTTLFSMAGTWGVDDGVGWTAGGTYTFTMERGGKKPKKLTLDANVAERFSPEERVMLARRIKLLLKQQIHHVIDNAWRELHSQTQHIW